MSVQTSRSRSSVASDRVEDFIICPSPHCRTPKGRPAMFTSKNTFAVHTLTHHMRTSQLEFMGAFCYQCVLNENEGIDEVPIIEVPSIPVEVSATPVYAMPVHPQVTPSAVTSGPAPVSFAFGQGLTSRPARAATSIPFPANPFGQAPPANPFGQPANPFVQAPPANPFGQVPPFGQAPPANPFGQMNNMDTVSVASAPRTTVSNVDVADVSDDVSELSMNSEARRFNNDLRGRGAHPQLRHMLVRQMQQMYP